MLKMGLREFTTFSSILTSYHLPSRGKIILSSLKKVSWHCLRLHNSLNEWILTFVLLKLETIIESPF